MMVMQTLKIMEDLYLPIIAMCPQMNSCPSLHMQNMQNQDEPRHDKTKKVAVRPSKTQISLGIRPD